MGYLDVTMLCASKCQRMFDHDDNLLMCQDCKSIRREPIKCCLFLSLWPQKNVANQKTCFIQCMLHVRCCSNQLWEPAHSIQVYTSEWPICALLFVYQHFLPCTVKSFCLHHLPLMMMSFASFFWPTKDPVNLRSHKMILAKLLKCLIITRSSRWVPHKTR